MKQVKILIISALPYNPSSTTRAFETYFSGIQKENLFQIYTNPTLSVSDKCKTYFQITDTRILKRAFHHKFVTGKLIDYKSNIQSQNSTKSRLFSMGKKNWNLMDLLRNVLWKNKYWLSRELKDALNQFKPDLIFFHNSNALFMERIAIQLKKYLKVPLIAEIADDYIFNAHFSLSPLYYIRRAKYKGYFKDIIRESYNIIYISEKMKDKYDSFFKTQGNIIPIPSDEKIITSNQQINDLPVFSYFGNIGLGRYKTLINLGKNLFSINPNYKVDVYCPAIGNSVIKKIRGKVGINLKNPLPYEEVCKQIEKSDYLVFVESFNRRNLIDVRYSLSTKIGDYIASGKTIIAFGPKGSGSIDFLLEKQCAYVCTNEKDIHSTILEVVSSKRNMFSGNQSTIKNQYFNKEKLSNLATQIILDSLEK